MHRLIIKVVFLMLFVGSVHAFAAEHCSADTINERKIAGIWEGSDHYYFNFRINTANKLCISILEDNSKIVRNIRDIVILDGKLKHLAYFTPSTKAYVIYTNIEITGDEMAFYWFSSYDNKHGNDSYYRRKVSLLPEYRTLPASVFSH